MKMIQVSKIALVSVLFVASWQPSYAISIGSISDVISTPTAMEKPKVTKEIANKNTVKNEKMAQNAVNTQRTEHSKLPNPALFIEDAAMTAYINSQLLFKRNMPRVNVTTENAVVSLSGTVDTQEQVDTLVKIASSAKGVKFVNTDNLKMRVSE